LRLAFLGGFLNLVYWNQKRRLDMKASSAAKASNDHHNNDPHRQETAEPTPDVNTAAAVMATKHSTHHTTTSNSKSGVVVGVNKPGAAAAPVTPASAKSKSNTVATPITPTTPLSVEYVSKDTWGCLGHLTPEQTGALEDMRRRFANATCQDPNFTFDDRTLLRFLRARKFDVDKAQKMLIHHLEWCNKYLPSLVTPKDVAAILPCGLARLGPMTKDGLPIIMIKVEYYEPSQFHDLDLFVK